MYQARQVHGGAPKELPTFIIGNRVTVLQGNPVSKTREYFLEGHLGLLTKRKIVLEVTEVDIANGVFEESFVEIIAVVIVRTDIELVHGFSR